MKVDSTLHSALPPPPKSEIDSRNAGTQPKASGSSGSGAAVSSAASPTTPAFQEVDHTSQGGAGLKNTARGEEVRQAAQRSHSIGFEVDPKSHEVTIQVVDENGEVIGKVPPEKLQDSMPEIEFAGGMKLTFNVNPDDHSVKITLLDGDGEVIRTVPPEYLSLGSIVNVEI